MMTMKHFRPALIATSLLAACPATPGETTVGTETTDGEESTDTTNGEDSQSTPVDPTTTAGTTTNSTVDSESESMSGPNTDPSTSSSTGPGVECGADDECAGDTPFCSADGACVACDGAPDPDAACRSVGENVCVAGECHECTVDGGQCSGSTPACDPDSLSCVGCFDHAHCPDSACNYETGVCNDISYVLYVDRLAADCMAGDGTMALPYCKVTEALTRTADEPGASWTIKVRAGNYLEDALVIPASALITMIGWEGIPRLRALDGDNPTLLINLDAKVYLDHLQFASNTVAEGVKCEGGTVWADDVKFTANKLAGYKSTDCTSTFNRSVFFDNDGGGVASYGVGTTTIISSYITGNGTQNSGDFGGIRTAQENQLHLIYSTVLNNLSKSGPRSLHCDVDAFPAEVRNSVIIAFAAPSVDCASGVFSNSVLDEGSMAADILVATMADIENYFEPMTEGVYKAKPGTLMQDVAMWADGDPKTDYNLQARPNTDGALDWPGADIPDE